MVKNTNCNCRATRFNFPAARAGNSQEPVTPVYGDPTPAGYIYHSVHNSCRDTHNTHKYT